MTVVRTLLLVASLLSLSGPSGMLLVRADSDEEMEITEEEDGSVEEEDIEDGSDISDDVDEFDEYEGQWKPHPDVTTVIHFPKYPEKEFPMGEKLTALIGFTNHGDEVFNVTAMRAFLQSPYDLDYYIQNFTAQMEGVAVPPQKQVSIEYQFEADPGLEPLEYWLSLQVAYNTSDDRVYISTVQNSTIKLLDTEGSFASNVGSVLAFFVAIFAAVFGYYATFTKGGEKFTKKLTQPKTSAVSEAPVKDDWGDLTHQKKVTTTTPRNKKSKKSGKNKK